MPLHIIRRHYVESDAILLYYYIRCHFINLEAILFNQAPFHLIRRHFIHLYTILSIQTTFDLIRHTTILFDYTPFYQFRHHFIYLNNILFNQMSFYLLRRNFIYLDSIFFIKTNNCQVLFDWSCLKISLQEIFFLKSKKLTNSLELNFFNNIPGENFRNLSNLLRSCIYQWKSKRVKWYQKFSLLILYENKESRSLSLDGFPQFNYSLFNTL